MLECCFTQFQAIAISSSFITPTEYSMVLRMFSSSSIIDSHWMPQHRTEKKINVDWKRLYSQFNCIFNMHNFFQCVYLAVFIFKITLWDIIIHNFLYKNLNNPKLFQVHIFFTVLKCRKEKSGVALTQLSLTLHNRRRIFYNKHYIQI